jgi:hypothetical protein
MYECTYYSFGTYFVPFQYVRAHVLLFWNKFCTELVQNFINLAGAGPRRYHFYLSTMDNPPDFEALLRASNNQIDKQWDEELFPSIMASLYSTVVVLLDDLVDENPQELRELIEMKKSLRLYTRRPRGPRQRNFNHAEARYCIYRDFLGPIPKFPGDQFAHFFRISRQRFIKLMEDVVASGDKFYRDRRGPTLEAMLLLPLQVLALGVAPSSLCHYYQMSKVHAKEACNRFDSIVFRLYHHQYLSQPTATDLKNIIMLHKRKHKVCGLMGSLDCTHVVWKNCPKAWEGSFKGKEKKTTIVLEAACDYNHYFWHASFGYPGSLNDVNILRFSSLYKSFHDDSLKNLEEEAGVVPFAIGSEEFNKVFLLTDGIYPCIDRFVKPIAAPVDQPEKRFTEWQERARKDIERAFGVWKNTWHFVQHPIHLLNIQQIGRRVSCALILHNMIVSDRIMDGDVNAVYNPNLAELDSRSTPATDVPVLLTDRNGFIVRENEPDETEREEHLRLQNAIKDFINSR